MLLRPQLYTQVSCILVMYPVYVLTVAAAVSDGRRSVVAAGAPNVRFFVAANSAASLVSTLQSGK